jgi:hypothetical protein
VRSPGATGLASSLSGYVSITSQRCSFQHRQQCGSLTGLARATCPSRCEDSLCRAFRRHWLADPSAKKATRIIRTVLVRSSNLFPFRGNCDSSEPETNSNYLTRLRAVSYRSWPPGSLLRDSGNARTPPEEPVNHALISRACTRIPRDRANQPGSIFPQSPGNILLIWNSSFFINVRIRWKMIR